MVRTLYADRNGLLTSLFAPSCILDHASQALLDIIDGIWFSILIVNFDRVNPVVNHDKNFSSIGYIGWGLRTQGIAVRLGNTTSIEYFSGCLVNPQTWTRIQ
jgi:hypothetical protein